MKKKNTKKIITHSGNFHSDDVFAVATVLMALNKKDSKIKAEIIRTRDESIIDTGDFVVDVGGFYDPSKNLFDHHQEGGAGKRPNNIPYASFGLVWKKFGKLISGSKEVAEQIDKKLVQPIDAADNAVEISKSNFEDINPYFLQTFVSAFIPTWKEKEESADLVFINMVDFASVLMDREITKAAHKLEASKIVEKTYKRSKNKKILVLNDNYPWTETIVKRKEPLFVVYPSQDKMSWHVKAVPQKISSFKNRKDFPKVWAGKRDEELAEITGVEDALFCHNKRFLAVARSKKGALKLADLAV